MTQPTPQHDPIAERAWARIGRDEWSQLAWFAKLANTAGFEAMSGGERAVWQEEFFVMLQKTPLLTAVLRHTKRNPEPAEDRATFAQWQELGMLPTATDMQQIRDAIAAHLERLADDEGTTLGPFHVMLMTTYVPNPVHKENPNVPRYNTARGEVWTEGVSHPYQRSLLFLMDRLLRAHGYADKLRRCRLCKKVFLQLKRSATYCGPKCYTVGGMRELRERRRRERELRDAKHKMGAKKKGHKATAKGGSRHGTKRR